LNSEAVLRTVGRDEDALRLREFITIEASSFGNFRQFDYYLLCRFLPDSKSYCSVPRPWKNEKAPFEIQWPLAVLDYKSIMRGPSSKTFFTGGTNKLI
jgi:hypothetical protein